MLWRAFHVILNFAVIYNVQIEVIKARNKGGYIVRCRNTDIDIYSLSFASCKCHFLYGYVLQSMMYTKRKHHRANIFYSKQVLQQL